MLDKHEVIAGSVYGLAYGDAFGARTEFMTHSQIVAQHAGMDLPAVDAYITDDTQMSLYCVAAVNEGMVAALTTDPTAAGRKGSEPTMVKPFADSYLEWLHDPQNLPYRAPGATCIGALQGYQYSNQVTGLEGMIRDSKGCGADMRTPWLGLLAYKLDMLALGSLAANQAATTHGHPTGVAAAVGTTLLTAAIVKQYRTNKYGWFDALEQVLNDFTNEVDLTYARSDMNEPLRLAVEGIPDVLKSVAAARKAFYPYMTSDEDSDLCNFFGEGWVAEEALMCATGALSRYSFEPVDGLRRLARTRGDSDSIGAIGGAFLGALNGYHTWPEEWRNRIEPLYVPQLDTAISDTYTHVV